MLASRSGRRGRVAGLTAALVTGVLCLSVTNAPSAQADEINTFHNVATEQCLEYGYSRDCDDHVAQQWNVHVWADGTRELRNLFVDQCLDDSFEMGLRTFPCNVSTYQSWYVTYSDQGPWFELRNEATGRCLDDSEYGLRTIDCNGSTYQLWY